MFNLLYKAVVGVVAFATSPIWMPIFFFAQVGQVVTKVIRTLPND